MEHITFVKTIKKGLGAYPLTTVIAEAIKISLTNNYESLIIVNNKGLIEFMDPLTEKFFNLSTGEGKGKHIKKVNPYSELPDVISTGSPYVGISKNRGRNTVISRFPIIKNGKVIGAFGRAILPSAEELERLQLEAERLREGLLKAENKIKRDYQTTYNYDHILGISKNIIAQKELAKRMARTNSDILIQGESGTGKEMFAHAIHAGSKLRVSPFIRINCPAIPPEIAESELFGYEKGAFTGANHGGKPGKFELAEGGTIFLDEIGTLPLSIQAKLLRVVQEREVERLGSKKTLKLNFRLISATNIDLKKLAEEEKFRFDLYFRLSKAILTLPPLRDRKEDIPIYVNHFIKLLNNKFETKIKSISREALDLLVKYHWPGNVREVMNVIEQSYYNMHGAEVLCPEHFPNDLKMNLPEPRSSQKKEKPLRNILEDAEKENILNALRINNGNKRKTASQLGIQRSALYLKIKKFGLID